MPQQIVVSADLNVGGTNGRRRQALRRPAGRARIGANHVTQLERVEDRRRRHPSGHFQHHDGWLSQLSAVPNGRAAYDAADSRAPRRSHGRSSCRTRSRCVSGNLDKPGAAQALADPTKSRSKKSPSHMSLTARDTPPRCSNSTPIS